MILKDLSTIGNDFVAASVMLKENREPSHALFLIKYNSEYYLAHYTGREVQVVQIADFPDQFISNAFDFIDEDEVATFLAVCKFSEETANPKYQYFYDGTYYKSDTGEFSDSKKPEMMSCVGYCLNILRGILNTDYIRYLDWPQVPLHKNEYIEDFVQKVIDAYPDIDRESVINGIRRITPEDYIISSYVENRPVELKAIEEKRSLMRELLATIPA